MVKVRSLESVPFSRYLRLCNVLRICDVRAIPTYKVYQPCERFTNLVISSLRLLVDTPVGGGLPQHFTDSTVPILNQ